MFELLLLKTVSNYYISGRVARAGRCGRAFSLVSSDETPFLLDLHLFLGKPINFANSSMEDEGKQGAFVK